MAMFEQAVLANKDAEAYVNNLRDKFCGYAKVYTERYMQALAKVCKYDLTNYNYSYIYNGVQHNFKSPRACGQNMEAKINDMFDFGILKGK